MKNAKRMILCLLVFAAVMLCTAYAFVPSPEACEHTNTRFVANGDDCVPTCADCGESMGSPWRHQVNCTTGACANCGATGVTGNICHTWGDYQHNDSQHWAYCTDCGVELTRDSHWVSCTTGVCYYCGATGVTGNPSHDWGDYQHDDTEHWHICKDCGGEGNRGTHWVTCTTGECYYCGATDTAVEVDHNWGSFSHSETEHWRTCADCGAEVREGHTTYCMNEWCRVCSASGVQGDADLTVHIINCTTGVCVNCGQSGVQGDISHSFNGSYQHDATGHWQCCVDCGEKINESCHEVNCGETTCFVCGETDVQDAYRSIDHLVNCTTGVCNACGCKGVGGTITHDYVWQYDENQHWQLCQDCGEIPWYDSHWLNCQGVCIQCGATGVQGNDCGHSWGEYQYDENKHWRVCEVCDEIAHDGTHWISCATGACENCGATGVTGETSHDWDWETYQYSDTEHWRVCKSCGETTNRGTHRLSCTTGECTYCGATGVTGSTSHNWGDYQHDDTEHWQCCMDCGKELNRNSHWVTCATGGCYYCGATDTAVEVDHNWGSFSHSETEHWRTCADCGTEVREGHTTYCMGDWCIECCAGGVQGDADLTIHNVNCITGVCGNCGQSGVQGRIIHNWAGYEHDKVGEWVRCADCNERSYVGTHSFYCDKDACSSCGETDVPDEYKEIYHYLNCTTLTCNVCGLKNVTGVIVHDYDYQYDENQHWQVCKDCGRTASYKTHQLNCLGVCIYCGATDVQGDKIGHDWDWDNYQYSDTQHWRVCKDCGEEGYRATHWVFCDSDTCIYCGVTCDPETAIIQHSYAYEYNEKTHWTTCTVCGYVERESTGAHQANCVDKVCTTCGMENVTIGTFTHGSTASSTYSFDETQHWRVCQDCGGKKYAENHWLSCADGTCVICGQSGVKGSLSHSFRTELEHNEYGHWYTCKDCGHRDGYQHYVTCAESTCRCGEPINEWFNVAHESGEWCSDGDEHFFACSTCGEESRRGKHEVNCGSDVCNVCGKEGVTDGTVLHWYDIMHDESTHWEECTVCGIKGYAQEHVLTCNTGRCDKCGAYDVEGQLTHYWYYEKRIDGDEVYYFCKYCGEEYDRHKLVPCEELGVHTVYCYDLTKCVECGKTVAEGEYIMEHPLIDDATIRRDEYYCYRINCAFCGEIIEKKLHKVGEDGRCVVCYLTGLTPHDEHTGKDVILEEATCTAAGLKQIVCAECGWDLGTEEIPALGHKEVTTETAATCTAAGSKVTTCETCGELIKSVELPALGHKKITTETAATCTAAGSKVTTCETCGETLNTVELPALGHKKITAETAATCTAAGSKVTTCETCGELIKSEELPALGHKEITTETAATCTATGSKVTTCETCGETLNTVELPALGHKEITAETAATCTATGSKVTTCETCGETLNTVELPALGHKEITTETAATCTATGSKVTTCETCGETLNTVELPALGHKEVITETAATCTAAGSKVTTCETCGEVLSEETYGAMGHAPVERVKEATCTEDGLKRTVCNRCGETLSRETLPALGHDRWVTVAQRATCTADGVRRIMCSRCKVLLGTETIPAKGHQLTRTDEGDHWLEVCGVCGSQTVIQKDGTVAEPTPAPEAADTPEPTVEPEPLVLPAEVAVKPVEKVEIQDVPATVMIVVQEVEEEEVPKLELPETIEAVKVLSVNLYVPEELEDTADTLIPDVLKISIELTEEEEKELADLKLVLILADGTMQEIKFEIKDGKLVFETEKQGVFAFVPADTII